MSMLPKIGLVMFDISTLTLPYNPEDSQVLGWSRNELRVEAMEKIMEEGYDVCVIAHVPNTDKIAFWTQMVEIGMEFGFNQCKMRDGDNYPCVYWINDMMKGGSALKALSYDWRTDENIHGEVELGRAPIKVYPKPRKWMKRSYPTLDVYVSYGDIDKARLLRSAVLSVAEFYERRPGSQHPPYGITFISDEKADRKVAESVGVGFNNLQWSSKYKPIVPDNTD